mmetsp:Transcript_381/g.697  ORF Transcript_381/g.697 Transcript_381/m.697 type:complete len:387 (+) Transcript_381:109-1269(+)|eukprot:CAMPEP_0185023378 /NCGR_PEP_ID=MMETSP1103-20130426/6053_1 /TAXON_ID=36769 /ORGANISM="Paraphysomonas bandaiensis, Strain Caron Lab Isolate" /LENGTH=386 /DNA_ID=CAMNT_0027555941 /DNA_START=107 /DNA_END=1267 /DNA_ORIENTATION=+
MVASATAVALSSALSRVVIVCCVVMALVVISAACKPNSTSISGWKVTVCCLLFTAFSVYVSKADLTVTTTFCGSLLLSAICYGLIRGMVGMPSTLKGNKLSRKFKGKRYQLVAMPVNHFGEKVRWCLDLIGAPYEETTVAGLFSIFFRGRSVPWLVDRQSHSVIGNSDEILMFMNAVHVPSLSSECQAKAQALLNRNSSTISWESDLNNYGHAIQGWVYFFLLDSGVPSAYTFYAWGGREKKVSWIERLVLHAVYWVFKQQMKVVFKTYSRELMQERQRTINGVLDRVDEALKASGGPFIFGSQMSYIDITFCALTAPLMAFSILYRQPRSLYARGRFESFSDIAKKKAYIENCPIELSEFEQHLLQRPSGQLVLMMYGEYRDTQY